MHVPFSVMVTPKPSTPHVPDHRCVIMWAARGHAGSGEEGGEGGGGEKGR